MRSLEQLIEEQVHRWSLDRRARKDSEARTTLTAWPVITISRQFGSEGAAIGNQLALATGFTFWDSELLHEMADATEANRSTLAWVDEHPRSAWSDFLDGMLLRDNYTESEYLRRLIRVLDGIQKTGSGVVVGRGSQFVVNAKRALRVRFVCPLDRRITRVSEGHELDTKEAARLIERVDHEREVFMQHHYDRSLADPTNFDIVLNTGAMSHEVAVQTILTAYEARFGRRPAPALAVEPSR